MFGRALASAPAAAPAGLKPIPNAPEVECLHLGGCESRRNGFACEKGGASGVKKPTLSVLALAPPFFAGARALPNEL